MISHEGLSKIMRLFLESIKDDRDRIVASQVYNFTSDAMDLVQADIVYIQSLESYLSELDETFDELLERAKKEAEKKIKEMPKEKPDFYG